MLRRIIINKITAEAARAAPDRDYYADLVRKLQTAKAASGML
jgi:hypothetical protein